jgi:hypothetical protein
MASFEPRGLGIKKELYSRKSYSGVSVPIGDNFKTDTTKGPFRTGSRKLNTGISNIQL